MILVSRPIVLTFLVVAPDEATGILVHARQLHFVATILEDSCAADQCC